ncbi:MAG: hypothetical protein AVDCRST_MAG25-2740, partial [uncultured Rubrobacteraceae bacterium]
GQTHGALRASRGSGGFRGILRQQPHAACRKDSERAAVRVRQGRGTRRGEPALPAHRRALVRERIGDAGEPLVPRGQGRHRRYPQLRQRRRHGLRLRGGGL